MDRPNGGPLGAVMETSSSSSSSDASSSEDNSAPEVEGTSSNSWTKKKQVYTSSDSDACSDSADDPLKFDSKPYEICNQHQDADN